MHRCRGSWPPRVNRSLPFPEWCAWRGSQFFGLAADCFGQHYVVNCGVEITPHYLSALERGVYNIKLELLVKILNTLDCSADEAFQDVVNNAAKIKASELSEKLNSLSLNEQKKIYEVIETMLHNASN